MYIAEAEFFKKVLASDISKLPIGSHIVEVGSGNGLLALKLAANEFEVTAFEPQSYGFTEMYQKGESILSNWIGTIPNVNFRDVHVDDVTQLGKPADYIFAVNVIEHVPEYPKLIRDALRLKHDTATLRLICPNYTIPYEPHVNIPIILTKQLTWRIFKNRIKNSCISNPIEFWQDLSWPTQRKLNDLLKDCGFEVEFSREATLHYIDRALNDPKFIERKGPIFGTILKAFATVARHLTRFIPISLIPIIDCRITNKKDSPRLEATTD